MADLLRAVNARDKRRNVLHYIFFYKSLELAASMIELNALDARGYRIQTAVWELRKDHEQVIAVTQRGLQQIPSDPFLLYHRGMAEKIAGTPMAAVPFLERAARAGSSANDIQLQIAHAYELAERVDEAAQAYLSAGQKTKSTKIKTQAGAMGFRMLANRDRCEEATKLLSYVPTQSRGNPTIQEGMRRCGMR